MCPPLDDADKKFIKDLIGETLKPETIGAVVKAHVDGLKLGDIVAGEVKKAVDALPKPEPPKSDDDKGKGGGKGKGDADTESAQRIAALEKSVEDERKARREAEQKGRTDRLHSETRAALQKAGIPAERVHLALAAIKDGGSLVVADDGTLGWKGKDKYGVDTTLSLEEGAKAWATTDDGKAFLPARGSQGTGDGAGSNPPIPKTSDGKVDLAALRNRVTGAVMAGNYEE